MPNPSPSPLLPKAQITPAAAPDPAGNSLLMVAVVVVAALYLAREVLVPVTIAVLLSFLLAPLVALLRRARLGRTPAVLFAVFLTLCVILALGGAIGTQIASLVQDIPRYSTTVEQKIETVRGFTIGRINGLVNRIGRQFAGAGAEQAATSPAAPAAAQGSSSEQKPIPVEVHQPNPTPLELVGRFYPRLYRHLPRWAL